MNRKSKIQKIISNGAMDKVDDKAEESRKGKGMIVVKCVKELNMEVCCVIFPPQTGKKRNERI